MAKDDNGAPAGADDRPRRRRRRWPRRLAIALVLLAAAIWASPYLISTGTGTSLILSLANPRLKGELAIGDLSVSWLGPTVVRDIRVIDPQGREALHVPEVRWSGGVWRGIVSPERFGKVVVDSPTAVLYVGSDGTVSLAEALESPPKPDRDEEEDEEDEDEEDEGPPEPFGTFNLRSATVTLKREGRPDVVVRNIGLAVNVRTLNDVSGEFGAESAAGRVTATFEVAGLYASGKPDVAAATGTLALASRGPLDVGALAAMAGRSGLTGRADLSFDASLATGTLTFRPAVIVSGLKAPGVAEPLEVALDGLVHRSESAAGTWFHGWVGVKADAGTLRLDGRARTDRLPKGLDAAAVAAALLGGEPLELPEFTLRPQWSVDLARLARAAPELLKIRKGVAVTRGELASKDIVLTGGATPAAAGHVALTGVEAVRGERTIRLAPAAMDFDLAVTSGTGLEIRQASISADFADLRAAGTPSAMTGTFSADLARLHRQLSEVVDLGRFELAGTLAGRIETRRARDGRVDLAVTGGAKGLKCALGEKTLDVARAEFSHRAEVTFDGRRPGRVTVTESRLSVPQRIEAAADGWYDLLTGGFDVRAEVARCDLAYLAEQAAAVGVDDLAGSTGVLSLTAAGARATATAPVLTSGTITGRALAVRGEALSEPGQTARLLWRQVRYDPSAHRLTAPIVRVVSAAANLSAGGIDARFGKEFGATGELVLTADLARCARVAAPFLKDGKPPAISGRLRLTGSGRAAGPKVTFTTALTVLPEPGGPAAVDLTGTGWLVPAKKTFDADVTCRRADLGWLGRQAAAGGIEQAGRYAGLLAVRVRASRARPDGPVLAAAGAALRRLRVDGRPLDKADSEVTLTLAGARIGPEAGELGLKSLSVAGPAGTLTLTEVDCAYGKGVSVSAKVSAKADLARCLAMAAPVAKWEKVPDVAGEIGLDAEVAPTTEAGEMLAGAAGTVRGLTVDGKPVAGDGGDVTFSVEKARIRPTSRQFAVASVRVDGGPASLRAEEVSCALAKALSLDGRVELTAELGGCAAVAAPFLERKDLDVSGRLTASGRCRTGGETIHFDGGCKVHEAGATGTPAVALGWTGSFRPSAKAFSADVEVRRADLAYAAKQAKGAGYDWLDGYTGVAAMKAIAGRASPEAPILASGSAKVADLLVEKRAAGEGPVDGKPSGGKPAEAKPSREEIVRAPVGDVSFSFTGVSFRPKDRTLAVASASLHSDLAVLTATRIRAALGEAPAADGKVRVTADVGKCLKLAAPVAGWEDLPEVAGRFDWSGQAATRADTITLSGTGGVNGLELTREERTVREGRVDLALAAEVDTAGEVIHLKEATVKSATLDGAVRGTVSRYKSERLLDLRGRYRADLERLLALVAVFRPDAAEAVALRGVPNEAFTVTGPAHRPKLQPSYRKVAAETAFGWQSAETQAVKLGRARLTPSLADGLLRLPVTDIPASGGTVRIGCTIDLTGKEPWLRTPDRPLQVMQDVFLDVDLSKKDDNLLRWINPIFRNRMKGTVSMRLTGVELPLADSIKTTGTGTGRLDLRNLRIQSGGLLAELLSLGGLAGEGMKLAQTDGLDFRLRNGRVVYDDFTIVFSEVLDLKFKGSVGFDETLEMNVLVPVRPALLERLGLKGPVVDVARRLSDVRIPIPIGGTIREPKLDLSKVDLKSVLPVLPGLLESILRPREPAPPETPTTGPATRPAAAPEDFLLDGLFDLLRRRRERKKEDQ